MGLREGEEGKKERKEEGKGKWGYLIGLGIVQFWIVGVV